MTAQPFSLGLNARGQDKIAAGQKRTAIGGGGVLVAGPHPFFRLGLLTMLRSFAPAPRLREVDSLAVALSALRQDTFDLVLLDLDLVLGDFVTLGEGVRAAGSPAVIAFADAPETVPQALGKTLGTVALFSRAEQPQTVRMAVESVLGTRQSDRAFAPDLDGGPQANLTERQKEVHQLMLKGLPNKEIARRLGLSPNTVKVHMTIIFKKLGIASRYQALAPQHTN